MKPQVETLSPQSDHSPQRTLSRRSLLGWLLGGATVVAAGATGFSLYLNRLPEQAQAVLKEHSGTITSLAWSPSGDVLVSSSQDQTVRFWRSDARQSVTAKQRYIGMTNAVAWNPAGTLVAGGNDRRVIQVWDTQGTLVYVIPDLGAPVNALVWKNDTDLLATTAGAGVYQLVAGKDPTTLKLPSTIYHTLAIAPNKNTLALGTESGDVAVYDLSNLQPMLKQSNHNGPVLSLAWSADGARLASGGTDKLGQVLDIASGKIIHTLPHDAPVYSVSWDVHSGYLATASGDGLVNVWDVDSSARRMYNGHAGAVTALAWGPQKLASGSANGTIILWNAQ